MRKKAYVFLADGFEEIEALSAVDVLRRADVNVETVSVTGSLAVLGAHSITVVADVIFGQAADFLDTDLLVLPGGMPGASTLASDEELAALLREALLRKDILISAICAAPMVLGRLGLLRGRRATCYPGFESYLEGAVVTGQSVTVDGPFITGRGPGASLDFSLALVERLIGPEKSLELASAMCKK